MSNKIEMTGMVFDRWKVLSMTPSDEHGHGRCLCKCSCKDKTERIVDTKSLRQGNSRSCGCLTKEVASKHGVALGKKWGSINGKKNATHRAVGTPTHNTWKCMKQRCLYKKDRFYNNYGGRGIAICDRWLNSFENFLFDLGERPEGMTLHRINNDGNYEPSNCEWKKLPH